MKITPSIPFHVARAYGTRPVASPSSATAAAPAPVPAIAPVAKLRADDAPTARVQELIAGRVSRPVDFDDVSTPTAPAGAPQAYQLYNRAADKLEAAVRVGTNLDLHG